MLEKLNKKSLKLNLRRETLWNLKKSLGFKGEGVEGSPVVIDDLGDTCVELNVKTEGVHLALRNLIISKLLIMNSQNVSIENCFVGKLRAVRCRNLTFRNNSIVSVRQLFCRSCIFENNSLQTINNTRNKKVKQTK